MQRTKEKIVETKDYILNFTDQTCYIRKTKEIISTSIDILQELARSHWREEKRNQKFHYYTMSYEEPVLDGIELFYFLSDSINNTPLNKVLQKEYEEKFYKLLLSLPQKQRIIMWKYFYERKNELQISQEINIKKDMVHYYKKKSIKFLKETRSYEDFL